MVPTLSNVARTRKKCQAELVHVPHIMAGGRLCGKGPSSCVFKIGKEGRHVCRKKGFQGSPHSVHILHWNKGEGSLTGDFSMRSQSRRCLRRDCLKWKLQPRRVEDGHTSATALCIASSKSWRWKKAGKVPRCPLPRRDSCKGLLSYQGGGRRR